MLPLRRRGRRSDWRGHRRRARHLFLRRWAVGSSTGLRPLSGFADLATRFHSTRSSSVSFLPGAGSSRAPRPAALRQQRVKIRRVAHHAGDLARRIARTGEEIAARRPDNRRAGVLRDHQPAELLRRRKPSATARLYKKACRTCAAAGRPPPSGPASAALSRPRWARARVVDRRLAEEDVGAVLPENLVDALRVSRQPGADRLHRHLVRAGSRRGRRAPCRCR